MQYSQIKPQRRHPDWFKIKLPSGEKFNKVQSLVKTNRLNTIAKKLNVQTFLIVGAMARQLFLF